MRVENLFNPDNGNDVANQFRIYTDEGVIFQSYKTKICVKAKGQTYLNNKMIEIRTTKYTTFIHGKHQFDSNV